MATKRLSNLDMNKNQVLNLLLQMIAGDHGSPVEALIWYDSTAHVIKYRDNTAIRTLSQGGVAASLFDANTILKADTDDTPVALTIALDTVVARLTGINGGNIGAATLAQLKTALALDNENIMDIIGAMVSGNTETGIAVTYNDGADKFDFVVGTLDTLPAPAADLSLNTHKITGLVDPTNPQEAATKAYVDAAAAGIDWKASVRVATTANGALATAYENGDTIDGVTLATGNRILIKDQTAGAENGIYTVNASGAPTRATDADAAAEVTGGLAVFVEEGTTNADTGWVMTNNGAIVIGTTALVFTQFTGLGQVTAGAGLTKTGSTIDVQVDNSSIEINADTLRVKALGITDAMLASTFTKKFSATIGDGSTTAIAVTHSLGTRDVHVTVYDATGFDEVMVDIVHTSTTVVTLNFAVAPTTNQYRVVVIG